MKKFFPWRLFRKFALNHFLIALFASVLTSVFFLTFYGEEFVQIENLFLLLVPSLSAGALGLVIAYFSALPLRRVIFKALRLSSKKKFDTLNWRDDDDLLVEEPGEYFELEQALDKIRKKMRKRRLQLAVEREESEVLMGSLEDAVVSVNSQDRISFFNATFATHFMSRDQIEQQRSQEHLFLSEVIRQPEILDLVQNAKSEGKVGRIQISLNTQSEHSPRTFSITVSPLRNERDRAIYGVLCLLHDITELKLAEKIRIEFVENASHELRTPLTSVKGFLETLKEDIEIGRMEQVPYFLGVLTKNVDRLTDLVNDLLVISSLEHQSELEMESVGIEQMTQEVLERLSSLASDKKILLKYKTSIPEFEGDVRKIEQVVTNLVGNAIKYTQDGGVVEINWETDAAGNVVLQVVDNGPGISEHRLPRLFERFYRIDKGRSRDVGGTGLGLAIVKHIVQSHHGSVSVKSELGKGSTFKCVFPGKNQGTL